MAFTCLYMSPPYNKTAQANLIIVFFHKTRLRRKKKTQNTGMKMPIIIGLSHINTRKHNILYKVCALCAYYAEYGRYRGNKCGCYTTAGIDQAIQIKLVLKMYSVSLSSAVSLVFSKTVAK